MEQLVGEIWKDIEGYEGLYQVSNMGRVKSCERYRVGPTGNNSLFKERILQQYLNGHYLKVTLCIEGTVKLCTVHRLVAIAFIDNINSSPQVNHIDGIKTNNTVSNLEWATALENQRHKIEVLQYKPKKGFESSMGIPVEQIALDGTVVGVYGSCKDAQRQTGIGNANINRCIKNKRSTAGGFKWRRYGSIDN